MSHSLVETDNLEAKWHCSMHFLVVYFTLLYLDYILLNGTLTDELERIWNEVHVS